MFNDAQIKTVLIVDDDPFDSLLIERNLRSLLSNAEIQVINDSRRAAKTFRDLNPDLMLLDISMPHLTGFDVLTAISAKEHEQSSVVMLSGSTSSEDKQRALELGADDYFVKPSSLAGYLELAKGLLSRPLSSSGGSALSRQGLINSICDLVRRRPRSLLAH